MRSSRSALPAFAAVLVASLLARPAGAAEPLRGTYVRADPGLIHVLEPAAVTYNTIYLNGCFGPGDCDIQYGFEDSRSNRSSIAQGRLTTFGYGQVTWDAVVDCVKKNYEPFDVTITDVDPGDAPHWESIVAGYDSEVGMQGVLGVSPWYGDCGVIDNAITYTFANMFDGDVDNLCWTVSQETAHAFGLEHEFLCEDPMTYRQDCPDRKFFYNRDVPCGEYNTRPCECPGATQNSFRQITDIFGPGNVETPTVVIEAPAEGENVDKGFPVRLDVTGDVHVTRVEVYANGRQIAVLDHPPFDFDAPATLSDGNLKLEVRAYNAYEAVGKKTVDVTQGQPCGEPADCADTETCVDGRCVLGPGQPGGLGEVCDGNESCSSNVCGSSDDGSFCSEPCEIGQGGCPDGFGCLDVSGAGVCWKGYDDDEGGCAAGGRGAAGPFLLLLGLATLALRRRRRD